MQTTKIDQLIKQKNAELKASHAGISIERSGGALYLRGRLPPKNSDASQKLVTQRIPLSCLGIRANPEGIRQAKYEAMKISGDLARKEFSWERYLGQQEKKPQTFKEWINSLEEQYFNENPKTPEREETWKVDYANVYKHLPQNELINIQTIKEVICKTQPDTRSRRRYFLALRKLAKFAGLDCTELEGLMGNYSLTKVQPRDIPSDEEILAIQEGIKDSSWQWVFRMMATYGLRNHEVFFCDFELFPLVKVLEGKTGFRIVWPLLPHWATNWRLDEVLLPHCHGKSHSDFGRRVTCAFARMKLPLKPYNLRHAWAVRALVLKMDIGMAAHQMGHSLQVHCATYHRWIKEETYRQAFEQFRANCPV